MIFGSLGDLVKKKTRTKEKRRTIQNLEKYGYRSKKAQRCPYIYNATRKEASKKRRTSASKGKGAQLRITLYIYYINAQTIHFALPYIRSLTLLDLNKLFCGPNAQDYK